MKTNVWAYALIFFLTSLLAVSCHDDSDVLCSTFSRVEKCMDSYPDSALNLLKSIPNPEELRGKSQADYALLMTQAMDKNYVKFTSDSLIAVALNYYTVDQRNPRMRAKAQFYYGRVMLELDNHEEAMKSFLNAKKMCEFSQEYKMLALIAEEIGMINRIQTIYTDALDNFHVSLALHRKLKDSLSIVRASQNIARVYLYENKWDSCLFYYKQALDIAVRKQYKSEVSILHELGIMFRSKGDLNKSEYYFLSSLEKETDVEKRNMECLSIGFLYLAMNKLDDARGYLKKSLGSSNVYTQIDAYNCLCLLEKGDGNYQNAIMYRETADSIQNVTEDLNSREQIAELQRKYENEKLQNENLQLKVRYSRFILFGTVAFMIVAILLCYYYYNNRNNKKKITEIKENIRKNEEDIERYRCEIKNVSDSKDQQLEEKRIKIGELNGKIIILKMQNKNLSEKLNDLGGQSVVKLTTEHYISTFRLLLSIREGLYKGKLSVEESEQLFGLFDFLYSSYVSRLRDRYSALTKHDLEICCLLKLGLTHEDLSRIFNTTSDSVTRAKGRLKGRLNMSSRDNLELFLREF